jgi:hypothetical protein
LEAERAAAMPFTNWARLCEGVLLIDETNKQDDKYNKELKNIQEN